VSLRLELVADGLDEPSDLAFAPDGHIVVAERAGRVRIVRDGLLLPEPALVLTDVLASEQGGLLGLALDLRFERTRFVYAVYTAASRSGAPVFRLVRLREVGDTLGERAVLLDDVPASAAHPAAAVRVGPDGKLYVAFDTGDDPGAAGDLASYNGKVLRLNLDGTTPDDQTTPVWASGILSPRGMGWQTPVGTLWIVDDAAGGSVRLNGVASSTRPSRGRVAATLALPPPVQASGLATYGGQLIPAFRGNVFVSASEPPHMLRLVPDARDPTRVVSTERLLEGLGQPVRAN
jgi:glucose/arabinose dehydrogenase